MSRVTRPGESTRETGVLYMAMELSASKWLISDN